MVPEFKVEDLPLERTAALVPGFAVKDLPLGRITLIISLNIPSVQKAQTFPRTTKLAQYEVVKICGFRIRYLYYPC